MDSHSSSSSDATSLICLPHAGGGVAGFYSWARHLPDSIEVLPISLPGREDCLSEPPLRSLSRLVEEIANGVNVADLANFAVLGQSFGALLAFEFCRYLRRTGRPQPIHLFVSSLPAPQLVRTDEPISELPDDEFINVVRHRYGGIPSEVTNNRELLKAVLPALRADIEVLETYGYQSEPPLASPITAMLGRDDNQLSLAKLAGWSQQPSADCAIRVFGGGHFFWESAPAAVAETVVQRLRTTGNSPRLK